MTLWSSAPAGDVGQGPGHRQVGGIARTGPPVAEACAGPGDANLGIGSGPYLGGRAAEDDG